MKKNLPIIIGVLLPIIFILVIAGFILIPTYNINPKYDFLYTKNQDYDYYARKTYKNTYKVVNGKLISEPIKLDSKKYSPETEFIDSLPDLFVYNTKDNTTHKITLEDTKDMYIDVGPSSTDGYNVEYRYGDHGILDIFGSSYSADSGFYITKDKAGKKLTGVYQEANSYLYPHDLNFIGWINK